MDDSCTLLAKNEEEMRKSGISLARSLYRFPGTIVLHGELGAGKTTFVQGFAQGLGITERITSPTYALEQRYGAGVLSHIDLYRLRTQEAAAFVRSLNVFPGIRVFEWASRTDELQADIHITITEEPEGRRIDLSFPDIGIPSADNIAAWMKEIRLPVHIERHVRAVANISMRIADDLQAQGRVIRRHALEAAALTHDLLRFVDFRSLTGDATYAPTPDVTAVWTALKKRYGTPHEAAAQKFLTERHYPDIGTIVRTHRGHGQNCVPETIEQQALAYADKRVLMDTPVTLDERFNDFMHRYGKGVESVEAREWRTEVRRIEHSLFPNGVPF